MKHMRCSAIVAAVVFVFAGHASAQQINKQGFNYNSGSCPAVAAATTTVDKFSDGTPLPFCQGRDVINGRVVATYKLVWNGHQWAKYLPSVVQAPQPTRSTMPVHPAPAAPGAAPPSASAPNAGGIPRLGYNHYPPACPLAPDYPKLPAINTDKFDDGTPLVSCGGREVNGNMITTFKIVWTGHVWAKYLPSVQTVAAPPQHSPGSAPPGNGGPSTQPTDPGQAVELPPVAARTHLDPVEELGSSLTQGLAFLGNLEGLARAMQMDASGDNALWDADYVATFSNAVAAANNLINGTNPYSLQSIVSGNSIAFDARERREIATMLAEVGFGAMLREANQQLVESVRQVAPTAIDTIGPDGHPVRFAQNGVLPRITDPSQRINWGGLDRAQRLVAILSYNRALQRTAIFTSWATTGETVLTSAIRLRIDRLKVGAAKELAGAALTNTTANLDRFMKAYTVAKFSMKLFAALLNAASAVAPTSISKFYMTVDDRPYTPNLSAHVMRIGDVAKARIYVVPHSDGGSVVTPLGLVSMLKDLGLGGPIVGAINALSPKYAQVWVARGTRIMSDVLAAQSKYCLNYELTMISKFHLKKWVESVQNSISIPAHDHKPVEINDYRVVKLPQDTRGVVAVDYERQAPFRYVVSARSPGQTDLLGELLIPDLYSGGGEKFFRIAIQVTGAASSVGQRCHVNDDWGFCNASHQCIYAGGGGSVLKGASCP